MRFFASWSMNDLSQRNIGNCFEQCTFTKYANIGTNIDTKFRNPES